MTLEELMERIAEALQIDRAELVDDASPDTIASWDSLGALGIISILSDALGDTEIEPEEIAEFRSLAAIVDFAKRKGIVAD